MLPNCMPILLFMHTHLLIKLLVECFIFSILSMGAFRIGATMHTLLYSKIDMENTLSTYQH